MRRTDDIQNYLLFALCTKYLPFYTCLTILVHQMHLHGEPLAIDCVLRRDMEVVLQEIICEPIHETNLRSSREIDLRASKYSPEDVRIKYQNACLTCAVR